MLTINHQCLTGYHNAIVDFNFEYRISAYRFPSLTIYRFLPLQLLVSNSSPFSFFLVPFPIIQGLWYHLLALFQDENKLWSNNCNILCKINNGSIRSFWFFVKAGTKPTLEERREAERNLFDWTGLSWLITHTALSHAIQYIKVQERLHLNIKIQYDISYSTILDTWYNLTVAEYIKIKLKMWYLNGRLHVSLQFLPGDVWSLDLAFVAIVSRSCCCICWNLMTNNGGLKAIDSHLFNIKDPQALVRSSKLAYHV